MRKVESGEERFDRLKSGLGAGDYFEEEFERDKIEVEPGMLRKAGRKVMDSLGIYSRASEKMRDREVMGEVLRTYRAEKEQRRLEMMRREEEREKAREKAREMREREAAEWKEGLERKALENDMSEARKMFEGQKQERFEGQRVQEMLERELNERLTTVGELEEAVLAEEEGVSKRNVEFEGGEIPVYDLTGKPFEMISHAVDYRYANWTLGNAGIGNKTAQDLLEHPENWDKRREEVEKEAGYGTRGEEAKGDVISASYVNSERNIGTRVSRFGDYWTLCYGFEELPADSLLYMTNGDAGSSNSGGKGETVLKRGDRRAIESLEAMGGTPKYNELVMRRYDESGEALKPSYIIAEDGHITEVAMRHAKYFGVPIVNIELAPYEAKLNEQAREAVESVSRDSSYEEISEAIVKFRRSPYYYHEFREIEGVGRLRDGAEHALERERAASGSFKEKICELEELEFEKRLDLIEEALKIGKRPEAAAPEGFEYFSVLNNQVKGTINDAPGSCDSITVQFRRKGDPRFVRTVIYDGGNVVQGEKAVESGYMTEEELEAGDSTVYQRMKPLVEEFIRKRGY